MQTWAVEGEVLTGTQRHGNKALLDIPEALGEMKTLPSVNGGNPVTRHGMDQVIDGIEAQKQKDIKTLTSDAG